MLLGQRLRMLKKQFVILERSQGPNTSNNSLGSFYCHEELPFVHPEPLRIRATSCPGGTAESYALKVYGDPTVSVSYSQYVTEKNSERIGWKYDRIKLMDGLRDKIIYNCEIYRIVPAEKIVYAFDGRSWHYDYILSTIPLPVLISLSRLQFDNSIKSVFKSAPIHLQVIPHLVLTDPNIPDQARNILKQGELDDHDVVFHYCASSCHPWYRTSFDVGHEEPEHFDNSGCGRYSPTQSRIIIYGKYEHTNEVANSIPLRPGKFRLFRREMASVVYAKDQINIHDIYLFGRYAEWEPKLLTHNTWHKSEILSGLD